MASELADALASTPQAKLVAVASRTPRRARDFARAFGVPRSYSTCEQLVADPEIDVVYIATPASHHADHCLLAIEAGKAVLCEKPFTTHAEDAERVVAAARNRGVFCMEAMWMQFIPAMDRAFDLVNTGAIGDPRMLTADFAVPTDRRSRLFDPADGGALLDRGVYPLHLAWRLFGAPSDLTFMVHEDQGVDEHTALVLRFAGGQLAVLSAALTSYGSNGAVLMGTTGRIEIHEPLCRPDSIALTRFSPMPATLHDSVGPATWMQRMRHHSWVRRLKSMLRPRTNRLHVPYRGNGYAHEVAEVMRCIELGLTQSPKMTLDQTVGVMRVVDRVRARDRVIC